MLVQDLRYAARLLGRNPGFTASAILTLALGIGMTTAIFSVVDAVLLRPVPFPDPDRLVMVWETDRDTGTSHEPGSWPDYLDFQQRSRRIDQFAAVVAGEATLTSDAGEPARLAMLSLTHGFLPLVGVTPLIGRGFTEDDDRVGGPPVMLISDGVWARVFQRDPAVLGRTLRLDDVPRTVIGVVPVGGGLRDPADPVRRRLQPRLRRSRSSQPGGHLPAAAGRCEGAGPRYASAPVPRAAGAGRGTWRRRRTSSRRSRPISSAPTRRTRRAACSSNRCGTWSSDRPGRRSSSCSRRSASCC